MKNAELVESSESTDGLDEGAPDLVFFKKFLLLLVVDNLLIEVAIVSELHDDAVWRQEYHRFLPSRKTYL